jgi:hypothetical protein
MRLSLAVAFFLAAIVSVDAAPQTNSKKAEADKFVQMITISGECTKLVHAGRPVSGCKSILVNMNYSTGVSAYWFVTEQTLLSFAGDGSRRVEQGVSIVVQAIDRVILATTDSSKADDATGDDAVAFVVLVIRPGRAQWSSASPTPKRASTRDFSPLMGSHRSSKHSKSVSDRSALALDGARHVIGDSGDHEDLWGSQ